MAQSRRSSTLDAANRRSDTKNDDELMKQSHVFPSSLYTTAAAAAAALPAARLMGTADRSTVTAILRQRRNHSLDDGMTNT